MVPDVLSTTYPASTAANQHIKKHSNKAGCFIALPCISKLRKQLTRPQAPPLATATGICEQAARPQVSLPCTGKLYGSVELGTDVRSASPSRLYVALPMPMMCPVSSFNTRPAVPNRHRQRVGSTHTQP
jgi:hypothetical protein